MNKTIEIKKHVGHVGVMNWTLCEGPYTESFIGGVVFDPEAEIGFWFVGEDPAGEEQPAAMRCRAQTFVGAWRALARMLRKMKNGVVDNPPPRSASVPKATSKKTSAFVRRNYNFDRETTEYVVFTDCMGGHEVFESAGEARRFVKRNKAKIIAGTEW